MTTVRAWVGFVQWIFATPPFEDEVGGHRARVLNAMIWGTLAALLISLPVLLPNGPILGIFLAVYGWMFAAMFVALALLQRKHLYPAAAIYLLSFWAGTAFVSVRLFGTLVNPAIWAFLIVIIGAGQLLPSRWLFVFVALSAGFAILQLLSEVNSTIPSMWLKISPSSYLLTLLTEFSLATMLVLIAARSASALLQKTKRQQEELLEMNQHLQEIRVSLEQRIATRTEEITRQKQYFEALIHNSPDAIVSLDRQHRIVACNPAFERLFGYSKEEALGVNLDDLITTAENRAQANTYTQQALHGDPVHATAHRRRKDGSLVEVEVSGVPVMMEEQLIGVLAIYHDITLRKRVEASLRTAKERAELLFRVVPSAIFTVDAERRITSANAKTVEITGYSLEELIGHPCTQFTQGRCLSGCGLFDPATPKPIQGSECLIRSKDGQHHFVLKNAEQLLDDSGTAVGGIESFVDITERKQVEEHLEHLATHDALTVLPNRSLFIHRLEASIHHAREEQGGLAVLFMDLDDFKSINDLYGHECGDQLLLQVAERIRGSIRRTDTAARVSGDEFCIMCDGIRDQGEADLVARKILGQLSKPFDLDGNSISISASIGISRYPYDGGDARALLKASDEAMYQAKRNGKNRLHYFDRTLIERARGTIADT